MLYFKKLIIKPIWLVPYGERFVQWTPQLQAWGRIKYCFLFICGEKTRALMFKERDKQQDWQKSTRRCSLLCDPPANMKETFF